MEDALPNAAHFAIVELEKMGKLSALITQNIDNLHQKAGSNPDLIRELHGNMQMLVCLIAASAIPLRWSKREMQILMTFRSAMFAGAFLNPTLSFLGRRCRTDAGAGHPRCRRM